MKILIKISRISAILLILFASSCRSVRTRELTGRIMLPEIKEYNDTVDFYIKQIELLQAERLKPGWIEDNPGFNIVVTISNKIDKTIYLTPTDWSVVYFVGIPPPEWNMKNDTIKFVNFFQIFPRAITPESSVDFTVSNFTPISPLFDPGQLNNIDPMLDFIQEIKFYYAPLPVEIEMGSDTVVINRSHRLRTDKNTRITSWSNIR